MRTKFYWEATSFAMCVMSVSGVLAITHAPPMMKALAHLGYPVYFSNLLGIGKLIGVAVILAPGLPFFQIFNNPVFANPTVAVGSAAFGRITRTVPQIPPRQIQFALKLYF